MVRITAKATRCIAIMLIATSVSCSPKSKYAHQIRELQTADVTAEVNKAVSKGDFRFVGVIGYTLIVPSVPDYKTKYSSKYEVRVIENTSDVIESPAHLELQKVAQEYAERYNKVLLSQLPNQ